jgi:hypothetical protein
MSESLPSEVQEMTLDEARAIVAAQDTADLARALDALATVLRFDGISAPKLVTIAEDLEGIARDLRQGEKT